MRFNQALRLSHPARVAFVGAGGKTTAMFQLAHELPQPVIVTATTHLGTQQAAAGDRHLIVEDPLDLRPVQLGGITVITGPKGEDGRTQGLTADVLEQVKAYADQNSLALLVEADGSRMHPLKAPALHEPPIPGWADAVIYLVGLSVLGKPMTDEWVHRIERFCQLSGAKPGEPVGMQAILAMLLHPEGGLKNIPSGARKVVVFNQADTSDLQIEAGRGAENLLPVYDTVLVASLGQPALASQVYAAYEPAAGIILADFSSKEGLLPRELSSWQGEPLIRHLVKTALAGGLNPVCVVTTGEGQSRMAAALTELPVIWVSAPSPHPARGAWLAQGIHALPQGIGAAIVLEKDQPQAGVPLIRALVEQHTRTAVPVIVPLVEDHRATPVLYDRVTFPALGQLEGDTGERAIQSQFSPVYLPWLDTSILSSHAESGESDEIKAVD